MCPVRVTHRERFSKRASIDRFGFLSHQRSIPGLAARGVRDATSLWTCSGAFGHMLWMHHFFTQFREPQVLKPVPPKRPSGPSRSKQTSHHDRPGTTTRLQPVEVEGKGRDLGVSVQVRDLP